jgi:uncharacterized membrane protein YebE (DUF533 family)
MINIDKIFSQILGASQGQTLAGGLVVGGLIGAMAGKTGKKIATTALQLGGAAAVAGLAYTAYQKYKAGQQQTVPPAGNVSRIPSYTPPPQNSGFLPPPSDTAATEALSLKLIRAMIGAAKADGQIDGQESAKIFGHIDAFGFALEEKSFLLTELGKPLTAMQVAASAATPEEAAEIYAVSVMAVNPHGPAERGYLAELSHLMNLDSGLAQEIHDRAAAV